MFQFVFVIFCAVVLSSNSVFAEDNLRDSANECLKKYELTIADLDAATKAGDVSTIDSCFWGCYFKKVGYINEKGEYDTTVYLAHIKEFMADEKTRADIEKYTHSCDSLKDAVVSDGEAGCEMGALLAACLLENDRKE